MLAPFVCARCKQRKGKCDKTLPRCGFCLRTGAKCEYPSIAPSATAIERRSLHANNNLSEPSGAGVDHASSTIAASPEPQSIWPAFPPVFFLDEDLFHRAQLELPLPGLVPPSYVSGLLGGSNNFQQIAATFFTDVHPWMPIISKVWFYNNLINPLSPPRADSILLLLSICLITWVPTASEDPCTSIYNAAKDLLQKLGTAGTISIRVVQAGIFIAIYELGHCVYPAAYISVGLCARYGTALGFDKDVKQRNTTALPWDRLEERRRVWWSILILDRFINLGHPSRMLATAEPSASDILPVDDVSWEKGIIPSSEPLSIGSPAQLNMGRFARFAQATYLLGKVFRHISEGLTDDIFHEQEAIQLNRTLHALANLSQSEAGGRNLEFCTQAAVCYCALLLLEPPSRLNMRELVSDRHIGNYPTISPEMISRKTALMSQNFLPGGSIPLTHVSPFILHLLYQACIILSGVPEPRAGEDIESLNLLRESLKQLTKRWLTSEAYLGILTARESMSNASL